MGKLIRAPLYDKEGHINSNTRDSDLVLLHLEPQIGLRETTTRYAAGYIFNGALHHSPGNQCFPEEDGTVEVVRKGISISSDGKYLGVNIIGYEVLRRG